jgi:hypothetical protein
VPLSDDESEEEPGDWDDVIMSVAAEMIRDIRREVEEKLGYTCSAGIARNKMLAKLAAGWKKPNQQVPCSFLPLTVDCSKESCNPGIPKGFQFYENTYPCLLICSDAKEI